MKTTLKKAAALLLAATMVFTLSACSVSTTWIAKSGETKYPVGVYLMTMLNKINEGAALVPDPAGDIFAQEVDGMLLPAWVDNASQQAVKEMAAVDAKFAEMGLSFSEDEIAYIDQMTEIQWMYNGQNFQNNGVAKTSVRVAAEIDAKRSKIFDAIYGPEGTKGVPVSELRSIYDSNYVKVSYISVDTQKQTEDLQIVTDPDKQKIATAYYDRIVAGAKLYDIAAEYEKSVATAEAPAHEHLADGAEHDTLIDLRSSSLTEDLNKQLKDAKVGDIIKYEDTYETIIFQKQDHVADATSFENVQSTLLYELKGDEFEASVTEWSATVPIEFNKGSLRKYATAKLFVPK